MRDGGNFNIKFTNHNSKHDQWEDHKIADTSSAILHISLRSRGDPVNRCVRRKPNALVDDRGFRRGLSD